jgi:hypothetical protein
VEQDCIEHESYEEEGQKIQSVHVVQIGERVMLIQTDGCKIGLVREI